jgi:hypothetical protein
MERFKNLVDKMSKGYLSVAEYDPNNTDPQNVIRGEALRALAKKEDIYVYSADEHEKMTNYSAFVEKKRREELEGRLAEAEEKVARTEELEKRLAELEGKAKV